MKMKHVISIGIDKANGLTPLGAAASGAVEFDNWAQSQGYTTKLFTDLQNKQVLQNDIFTEISRIVEEKICEQLIIFFSGHGILRSPNQEVWLLSNAKTNPNESINLTGSIDYARTTGIPYIVFISDACRILPTELQFTGNGSVIFPICDDNNEDCAIDVLYATRPGSPANEYNSKDNSKKFGLFTESIIEILNGEYPQLIFSKVASGGYLPNYYDANNLRRNSNYKQLSNGEWTIDTINIEYPLKSIVSNKARKISVTLNQSPDIRIQYQNPKPYLSKFDDTTAKDLLLGASKEIENEVEFDSDIHDRIQDDLGYLTYNSIFARVEHPSFKSILEDLGPFPSQFDAYNINSSLLNNAERIFDSKGRESFETQTGFTIVGNQIADVVVSNNSRDIFSENNEQHIRIYQEEPISSALIVLENGQSIPVAILEGFIGTLVFNEDRLLTINYTPSRNSNKYGDFRVNEKEIQFVRAFIASAANEGFDYHNTFANEFDIEGRLRYGNPGNFLRREKSLDPSLGLYAVYAYMQAGKMKDVQSVYSYMADEPHNLFFDVAMLSGNRETKLYYSGTMLAPFCPMLSLGWAYRQRFEKYLHPKLIEASKHLIPNLWTTFDEQSTKLVIELFEEGIIK